MPEFENSFDRGRLETTEVYQELWATLLDLTEADAYIESVRTPQTGPLDIEATAKAIGIPVTFSPDVVGHASIIGLSTDDPIEVLVYDDDYEKAMSFSHEIGHYLLYLTGQHERRSPHIEEGFCEYFGRMFSMPGVSSLSADQLTGEFVEGFCNEYQVSPRSFMLRLIEEDVLPERVIVDTRNRITPNPDYSRAISRHIVCLACEYGECAWLGNPYDSGLNVINLTDRELSDSFTFSHGLFIKPGDTQFELLQSLYS